MDKIGTLCILALLCVLGASDSVRRKRENKEEAEKLYADFMEWRMMDNPEYGTNYGIHTYDSMASQWTEEHFIQRMETTSRFLDRARMISREGLSDQDQLHLAVLEEHLGFFISGFAYRKYSAYNALAPLEPPTEDWEYILSIMKYNTISDYNKAFSRLRQLGPYVDQRIQLLNDSITNKLTSHKASLIGLTDKMAAEDVQYAEDSTYYKIMFGGNPPTGISDQQWVDLKQEGSDIIMMIAVPAWRKFKTFLDMEYAPNTREFEGVWSLPGGMEYYQACLRFHTTTNLTPLEVHQIGLQEVGRISTEMEKIMQQNNFQGTLQAYIDYIKSDSQQYYQTGEEKLEGYKSIIADMHSKLDTILLTIPSMPIDVLAASNPQGAGGMYSSRPLDGSRNASFTANVFFPETKPKFLMPAITLHEAEPGHHTQLSYSIEQGIPMFRAIQEYGNFGALPFGWPYYTGYVEGWALYAESLGIEMGAYDETKWPHSLFGMLSSEMFRACRLVVDTGMHAFGWSKQDGIDYFIKYTTSAPSSIENEINRFISWPGQATGYKIGQLKILELRQTAIDELGEQYDIREFNDEVLQVGAAPLSLLESRINTWISAKKITTLSSTTPTTTRGGQTDGSGTKHFSISLLVVMCLLTILGHQFV